MLQLIVWCGCPARELGLGLRAEGANHADINRTNIVPPGHESAPGIQRIAYSAQFQRAGKVVPTSAWDDQRRQLQTYKSWEMPVYCAITAENDDSISLIRRVNPLDTFNRLQFFEAS